MSSVEWTKDRETGRRFVPEEGESGKLVRPWQEDIDGQSRPSRHDSSRNRRETPRSESSQDPRRTLDNAAASSSNRKPSVLSPRPGFNAISRGDQGTSQPITILNRSSSKYHADGSHGKHRNEQRDHGSGSYNSPSSPRAERLSAGERLHTIVGSAQNDLSETYDDDVLNKRVSEMTMGGEFDNDREYTISASALATQGRLSSNDFRKGKWAPQDKWSTSPSTQGKGKGVSKDQQETQAPPPKSRYIAGTPGNVEVLDKSYAVRNRDYKKFFRPGRVFSTLWAGAFVDKTNKKNESQDSQFMTKVYYVRHNERVYTTIRRFVVVRLGDRFCNCLPVTTYDGRGYKKRGINLNEHGLIYSEQEPSKVDGIHKIPLFVKVSSNADRLSNNSYINYGRVYAVECNVKVKDVGELDSYSLKLLKKYYNEINHAPEEEPIESSSKGPSHRDDDLKYLGSGFAGNPQAYGAPPGASGHMVSSMTGPILHDYSYNDANRQIYSIPNTQTYQQAGHPQQGSMHQNTAENANLLPSHGSGTVQYNSDYDPGRWTSSQLLPSDPGLSYPSQQSGFQGLASHEESEQAYNSAHFHHGSQNPTSYPAQAPGHGPVSSSNYYQGNNQYGSYNDNNPHQPASASYPLRATVSDGQYHSRENFPPPIARTPQYQQPSSSGQYPPDASRMDNQPPPADPYHHQSRGHHQEPILEDEELELADTAEIIRNHQSSMTASSRPQNPRSGRDRNRSRRDHDSGKSGGRR